MIGADGEIGGYTLANIFVAPELAGAKQRDFALSLGPALVTELVPVDPRWDELVAYAALNTRLRPGDLLIVDSGPPGDGLRPGDLCQIETAEIGALRNTIV